MNPDPQLRPAGSVDALTMKKPLLCLTLVATGLFAVTPDLRSEDSKPAGERPNRQAGAANRPMLNPEARLKMLTEKLGLTPEQQEKVKAVYAKNVETLKTMRQDKSLSEEAKREKFMEMRKSEMQEIQAMLTPEQQEKMKEMGKEMRERAGAARGGRKPSDTAGQKPEQK
jgi:Spy/CpxP family protein refolding chaperone